MNDLPSFRAVVFDLDGTLLDTLEDIRDAVNDSLSAFGFAPRSLEEIRSFVGNGAVKLLERALPHPVPDETFRAFYRDYDARYTANAQNKTRPYPGILDLLREVRTRGYRIAVLSNKQDSAVRLLCAHYFPELVDLAVGPAEGRRTKPSPDGPEYICRTLGVCASDVLYVGDSETDMLTGSNAGMFTVAVTWGFRAHAALLRSGAVHFAETPQDILKYLPDLMDNCAQM